MTELYLVRHCETELNVSMVYYGWTDVDINEKGIKQAEKIKIALNEVEFDTVISSPLKRAVHTAQIISGKNDNEIIIENRLRELNFGAWEGLSVKEVKEKYKVEFESWHKDWINYSLPQGESYIELYNRVKMSLEKILTENKDKKILLVSHLGCLKIIITLLLKMDINCYWNFVVEQGAYSLFQMFEDNITMKKLNCGI